MARTVLITGANRGIGLELARACARRGDTVLGTARDPEGLAAVDGLRAHGDVTSFRADVRDAGRLAELAHMLSDRALDVLICNAGVLTGRGGLDDPDLTPEAFALSFAVNAAGPFFTVRAFLPLLRRAPAARVAVITSAMGSSGRAKGTAFAYRASKAAATNVALNLAAALRSDGIAVGAYHPGWARTDMGGPGAEIDAADAAGRLLARIDALTLARSGAVEDETGAPLSP